MKQLQLLLIATLGILFLQCKKDTPAPVVTIDSITPTNGSEVTDMANNTVRWNVSTENAGVTVYDVYVQRETLFGESEPSGFYADLNPDAGYIKIASNQSQNFVDIGTALDYGLEYNVKIDVKQQDGTILETINTIFTTPNEIIDIRDNNSYSIITYGMQTWMVENLRYLPEVTPLDSASTTEPCVYVLNYTGTNIDDAKNVDTLGYNVVSNGGVFYNYKATTSYRPNWDGFHLPSAVEWDTLIATVKKSTIGSPYSNEPPAPARTMASDNLWEWKDYNNDLTPGWNEGSVNNRTAFNAYPLGTVTTGVPYRSGISFQSFQEKSEFWTNTLYTQVNTAVYVTKRIIYDEIELSEGSGDEMYNALPIRYMKEVEVLTAVN